MTVHYHDDWVALLQGDCREVLRSLPAESINTCVTSPPYWGLRDYGVEPSVWGGDVGCEHVFGSTVGVVKQGLQSDHGKGRGREKHRIGSAFEASTGQFCECGAWRGALGLEPTPELYVEHVVGVFREIRRVMRKDATVWLNLGDSYASDTKGSGGLSAKQLTNAGSRYETGQRFDHGLKHKDLVGIPWRGAFALQADGWWLRSEVIWNKPNPMPESVTDRPTKSHEQIFLLTKAERYYYDAAAIAEPSIIGPGALRNITSSNKGQASMRNDDDRFGVINDGTRNKRSVWTVPTSPFPEAHFATFPPKLIIPCILAGSPPGGVILDPFVGSGTTALVSKAIGRRCVGVDASEKYLDMARRRCARPILLEDEEEWAFPLD